jgi:FdhD/NarQ family.
MYINEHMMDVYINDHLTMKLVCLPQHLTELVLGRLLTEQIITSSEDVDHIYICEYGKRAKVLFKKLRHAAHNPHRMPL